MRCRYCNILLAPLRTLANGEFCCDDHRSLYEQGHRLPAEELAAAESDATAGLLGLLEAVDHTKSEVPQTLEVPTVAVQSAGHMASIEEPQAAPAEELFEEAPPESTELLPLDFNALVFDSPEAAPLAPETGLEFSGVVQLPAAQTELASIPFEPEAPIETEAAEQVEPAMEPEPILAAATAEEPETLFEPEPAAEPALFDAETAEETEPELEPVYAAESSYEEGEAEPAYEESGSLLSHPIREVAASWRWLNSAWKSAPRDLRVVTVLLPILLAVALSPSVPKVKVQMPQVASGDMHQVQKAMEAQWKTLNQTISNRAAIAFADDFRSGLDSWESRSNLTTSWSYDAAGFVRPGPLAVFKPTVELSDYRFEFLGEIDRGAMGWAFRAADLNNYYAMKMVVVRPGPLPLIRLVRYAVINGKEVSRVEKPLPLTARADMLYRILVDVHGSDFTVMTQGQVVDFWSDNRLRRGGVGFFCGRGEQARLRWVEVSHQYDALGKLCAYLAPYGIQGRNGSMN